ncbi:unnamed protein product [Rotaria sordida]|uniref:Tetratricopeptide repeat protein n=1 Tax=Rotaria sordida TaxID=392033 RepID=A0A814TKP2_9BILA|nr:unnamed protein product [Rotaria sordida]CAF1409729.1 unnamed protein product [Rotaria sordida]
MLDTQKTRPFSASRQRRQVKRSSSLTGNRTSFHSNSSISGTNAILAAIDLRTPKQKIEDLEKEIIESKDESTPEQYLNQLVLMQVYTNLEYGENSIENARAYINLSKYYLNQKLNFLPQAKFHALNARQIFEYLNIKPNNDNLIENLLAYDIYLILIKCSINAKQYSLQRELKIKNKHILSMDKVHIDHDFNLIQKFLEKLKHLMKPIDYEQKHMEYLFVKFNKILIDSKEFDESIYELIDQIIIYIEKFFSNDQIKRKIDLYLHSGSYLINYDENIQNGLKYYRQAVELANEQEKFISSIKHKYQLANVILQRNIAKVRTNRLTDDLENEFQQAIQLYKQPDGEMNKNVLKVIDELATFYTKAEKYQDALNVLCETLPDKIRLFGDFSEEVIQTESRIGAIYLREGECLNAAEHLKTCLDLQEFVYGPNDSRTCQTRNSVELLKKDPMVSRTFFARTQDGIRQDRPMFRVRNKVSHEKEDLRLLQTVTRKPPISSKT